MRRGAILANVCLALGLLFGEGSLTVISQDNGTCPEQPVGVPFTCDHAYYINGNYVWMRPLYTELGIASLASLASSGIVFAFLRSRPLAIGRNVDHHNP